MCIRDSNHSRNNKNYKYYGYRCPKNNKSKTCAFKTVAFEKRMELELLANLERIVNDKKMHVLKAREGEKRIGCHDVAELQKELERVNYAWRKGRIKSVEAVSYTHLVVYYGHRKKVNTFAGWQEIAALFFCHGRKSSRPFA